MRSGALALLAIGCALILGGITFGPIARAADDAPVERGELISLLRGARLTDGALQGFPDPPVQTSSLPSDLITQPAFRDIYLRISRTPQSQRNPDWLANAALLEMVKGDLDSAIDFLQEAARANPSDKHRFKSDLAAIYLERAKVRQQPHDLLLAAAAVQACQEGGLWEACFNHALALERLHLDSVARSEWKSLLAGSAPSPEWREEAEIHWWSLHQLPAVSPFAPLDLLASFNRKDTAAVQTFIRSFPQEARSYVEESLLGEWAQIREREPRKADQLLRLAEMLGEAFDASHRDRLPLETVQAIRSAERSGRVSHLMDGHSKFAAGYTALKTGDCLAARPFLTEARAKLEEERSPFGRWAAFYQAICSYWSQDYAAAEALVAELAGSRLEPYVTFEARLRWLQGLLRISRADLTGSLQAYLRALDLFEQAGEAGNVAALSSLIAEDLSRLGQRELAWKYRERALALLREKGSTRIQTILDEAAEAALQEGHSEIARHLQDEVVSLTEWNGTPHEVAEAHLRRIAIQIRLGDHQAAEQDLRSTLASASQIPNITLRARLEADALLAIGEARLAENPGQVLLDLDRALSLYDSTNYRFRTVELRRLRALASEARGDWPQVEIELASGAHEIEAELANLPDDLRASYLRQAGSFFDERVRIASLERQHALRGLLYAESARLLSPFLPPSARHADLGEDPQLWITKVRQRLPDGTLVLVFQVLDRNTFVWSLHREGVEFFTADLGREKLQLLIDRLKESAASPRRFREEAAILFEQLVRPALRGSAYTRFVMVPDKDLWGVPFAALYNTQTGQYLIQEASVAVTPCMSLLLGQPQERSRKTKLSLLALGDPTFDHNLFPMFTQLPNARLEAELATSIYTEPQSHIMIGDDATVEAFIESAPFSDVVQFSGHAVETESSPLLIFAPSRLNPSGVLSVKEIARLDLSRTRLVILAGCHTARPVQGEGLASLSASFLAAGVQEVIGSLWKIEDRTGEIFLREFHRRIVAGASGEESLQETQRFMLLSESARAPASWAAFQLITGARCWSPS